MNGNPWLATVTDNVVPILLGSIPVPPGVPVLPWVLLNDIVTGVTWRLIVIPSPARPSYPPAAYDYNEVTPTVPGLPTQLLVTAPNGTIYALQIGNGVLQSALPSVSNYSCSTAISTLAGNVQDRLEESRGAPGIFWSLTSEIYTGLVEAMNDLMLLVGRPTMSVQIQFNLTPNTVWQRIPKGIFLVSDIIGGTQSSLRKVSLHDMDYVQSSWGPDWENDTSPYGPIRWLPVGMTMFAVHPAPSTPMSVQLNAIAYPVAESWPYNGTEIVPFQHEFHVALEEYTAHYCAIKEGGAELQNSMSLYSSYLALAKRMTEIETRKDDLIFSPSFGAPAGLNPLPRR